jgi:hypothetical protein
VAGQIEEAGASGTTTARCVCTLPGRTTRYTCTGVRDSVDHRPIHGPGPYGIASDRYRRRSKTTDSCLANCTYVVRAVCIRRNNFRCTTLANHGASPSQAPKPVLSVHFRPRGNRLCQNSPPPPNTSTSPTALTCALVVPASRHRREKIPGLDRQCRSAPLEFPK